MSMTVLVTGGAGYIGSHACVALHNAGYEIIVVDDLSNSSHRAISRVEHITGKKINFQEFDVREVDRLRQVFQDYSIDSVMHFAGLKSVGDSNAKPLSYYAANVSGTVTLLEVMSEMRVKRIVFSSSATVYGEPQKLPISEDHPLHPVSPYGRTKHMVENVLKDLVASDPEWAVGILRYFNPVGAHESGFIGEDPSGVPSNLVPFISQVAAKRLSELIIFGTDYPTADGTGIRDYIHVMDLVEAHVAALKSLCANGNSFTINLGTGNGYSVLEVLHSFEAACGQKLRYRSAPRRPGDVAVCYADASRAQALLGWRARRTLEDMCRDHWSWQRENPAGYQVV
jgi:UDP-glucose 4-epimerase